MTVSPRRGTVLIKAEKFGRENKQAQFRKAEKNGEGIALTIRLERRHPSMLYSFITGIRVLTRNNFGLTLNSFLDILFLIRIRGNKCP
jgi:hypothetical protein